MIFICEEKEKILNNFIHKYDIDKVFTFNLEKVGDQN